MPDNLSEIRQRAEKIGAELERLFPDAHIALNYTNVWELLVAVILSAQCTDVRVNIVTEKLFKKYPKFEDYLQVDLNEFTKDISSINFFNNKAKNILATAKIIHEKFSDRVPDSMSELLALPGVARKTANVILGTFYKKPEGIVVDTHVMRFAQKFGLSQQKDPVKIEQDLMQLFPKHRWVKISYQLINYGREICTARPHECERHPLTIIYPFASKIWPKK